MRIRADPDLQHCKEHHLDHISFLKQKRTGRDPGFQSPDPDRRKIPDPSGSETLPQDDWKLLCLRFFPIRLKI